MQAAYLSGYIVNFGRLSVSSQGLHDTVNGTLLAWSNIESIKIDHTAGPVCIKQREQKGDWATLWIGQFSNLATLCQLLETDAPRSFAF